MGYAAQARQQSAQAAVSKCVLTLQRDGNVRVEGNRDILGMLLHEALARTGQAIDAQGAEAGQEGATA